MIDSKLLVTKNHHLHGPPLVINSKISYAMWRLNADNRIKHSKEAVKQLNTVQETDYFKALASQNKPVLEGNESSI